MKKNPSFEELEKRVEELEQRILEQGRAYESQVEEAEALQSLLNALTESVMLVDLEGRILTINEIGAQRLGKSVSDMIGTKLVDYFPPELVSYRMAWGEEVARTGKPVRFQDERAGRFYDTHDYPVFDRQGKVRAVAIYSRDITENLRIIQALLESEENFRALAENANDGILIAAREGVHVYANRRVSEITGYGIDELLETGISGLASPDEAEGILLRFEKRIRGEKTQKQYETRIVRKDGTTIPIEVTASRTTWKGEPSTLVIMRDITERSQMERDLRGSEERFRAIFDGALDSIFVFHPETGRVLDANPAAAELLLRDVEEMVDRHYLEFVPADCKGMIREVFESMVEDEGRMVAVEARLIRSDASEVPVEGLGQLIQIGGGPVVYAILRDITERKRMEKELLKTQKLESLGVLAGGIAHDFNNILTAISTNISMAKMYGNLEEDISDMLGDAEKASVRAKNLTQQLLAFSRGGAPVRRTVSVAKILQEHTDFALSGSNVKCEYSVPKDLRQVEADEGQIGQVVHNLVINAKQAMPEGGVVRVGAENVSPGELETLPLKPGRYVKIFATDQGIGIPARHLDKIFDPFFTTKQKGSGLGLTSAFTIVRNHEGHLQVDSEVGVGTTVRVYLPASDEGTSPGEKTRGRPLQGRGRVLLVDDEEIVRASVSEALTRLGYDVKLAADGAEGVRMYEEAMKGGHALDVVLLDLTIPGGMGGKDAVQELLRIDPNAKVIASSGYSNDPVMADHRAYGFREVIVKPYRIDDLGEVLHKVINHPN